MQQQIQCVFCELNLSGVDGMVLLNHDIVSFLKSRWFSAVSGSPVSEVHQLFYDSGAVEVNRVGEKIFSIYLV